MHFYNQMEQRNMVSEKSSRTMNITAFPNDESQTHLISWRIPRYFILGIQCMGPLENENVLIY